MHILLKSRLTFLSVSIYSILWDFRTGAIKESRDRIISALKHTSGGFPIRRVIINLAPADIKKTGTGFDLPIALAILEGSGKIPKDSVNSYFIMGELSLEGKIRSVNGVLAMVIAAKSAGINHLIVHTGKRRRSFVGKRAENLYS